MTRFSLRRSAAVLSTLLISTALAVFVAPTAAQACIADPYGPGCYRYVTGTVTTSNLNVRTAPWGTVIDNVPHNYANIVDCYVQASDGTYWDWLYDSQIGRPGWVYDPYLYTGGNIYQQVDQYRADGCGSIPLTIPSNVTATATGTSTIHVTWGDTNGHAAQYVISNGNVSSPTLAAGTTGYYWTTGLSPGTYMCFTVAAKENGAQSPWSPYGCTTTRAVTAPTNVTATATSDTTVHVSWTDTTGGGASFVVNSGGATHSVAAGVTGYDWPGLSAHTNVCFTVTATQAGHSATSGSVCTLTQDPPWCPTADSTHPTCSTTGAFQQEWSYPNDDFDTVSFDPNLDPTLIDLAAELQGGFNVEGWTNASGFYGHYLDYSGTDYHFNSVTAYDQGPGFATAVNATVQQRIGWTGSGSSFDSGWIDFPAQGVSTSTWQSTDWAFAVGHGYYRVVGTRQANGTWAVHLQLSSYYQFSPGTDFTKPFGPVTVTITGQQMHRLAQIGFARNFRSIGDGDLTFDASGNPM